MTTPMISRRGFWQAFADMSLSQADDSQMRYFSMSRQINADKKSYYDILERTQKQDGDITAWLIWYLDCMSRAIHASDDNAPGSFLAKLIRKNHDECGATYIVSGPLAQQHDAVGFELWICNVTHDVLSGHPRSIYIHEIR